jgi:MFS family permease
MKRVGCIFEIRIVYLITLITMINYLDRSAIAFAILPIEKELALNNSQFGLIASGFGIGYLVMAFFGGFLVDRFHAAKVWACGAILWSLATMAICFSKGFASLFILRIVLGLAEGIHFPALLKIMTDWLAPNFRARSISLGLLGVPLASLFGSPFITYLIESISWRGMFVVLGSIGILWAVFWLFLFRGKKNPHLGIAELPVSPAQIPWKAIVASRIYLAHTFIYFVFAYVVFFALTWLPGYFEQSYHISIHRTGFLVMVPWLASAFFLVSGGWVSDFLFNKTRSIQKGRTIPIAIAMLLSAVCFAFLLVSDHVGFNLAMMSLGLGLAFFINAPIYAANADLFPKHSGVVQGISSCFFAAAGILSPLITGWLTQSTGTYRAPILLVAVLCLTSSLAVLFVRLAQVRN